MHSSPFQPCRLQPEPLARVASLPFRPCRRPSFPFPVRRRRLPSELPWALRHLAWTSSFPSFPSSCPSWPPYSNFHRQAQPCPASCLRLEPSQLADAGHSWPGRLRALRLSLEVAKSVRKAHDRFSLRQEALRQPQRVLRARVGWRLGRKRFLFDAHQRCHDHQAGTDHIGCDKWDPTLYKRESRAEADFTEDVLFRLHNCAFRFAVLCLFRY